MTSNKYIADLLKLRYKVIADWPLSQVAIGTIIIDPDDYYYSEAFPEKKQWPLSSMPHLFKKLHWWEDRKPEEMPEYVKYAGTGEVKKVGHFDLETTSAWFMYLDGDFAPYCPGGSALENTHWLPATEQDYLNYINSKK